MPQDSQNKILIISHEFDPHVDWMVAMLEYVGTQCIRWPTKFFPLESSLSIEIADGRVDGSIEIHGQTVALSAIRSIWYRQGYPFTVSSALPADERRFAESESNSAFSGLLRLVDCLWVNHPDKIRIASCKVLQLRVAQELGFLVPRTLISNDPDKVRGFFAECDGEIVYKAFASGFVSMGKKVCLTSTVSRKHLDKIDLIRTSAGIFQENIHKQVDLRITVIGRSVFAVEIHSQDEKRSVQDWRAGSVEDMRHCRHELPAEIERLCLAFLDHFGLVFGAIDMILTPDGRYIFLENNPTGQFGWVEGRTGLPLTAALAEMLIAGRAF
jgi:glutathione synthase/RimK-type ligase-like ATP-grasp enzyme